MASLRPSLEDLDQLLEPLEPGELAVARALATLDDGWTVYVQPRIGLDVPDFVAVHDLAGVCAIEVKDWRRGSYRQDDRGVIEYRDRLGGWHRSAEQPRYQASRYRTTIYDQFFALPSDGPDATEAVRAVVVLPQFSDAHAVELLSHPAVSERERRVAVWGGEGLAQRLDQMVRGIGCAHPRPESIARLKQHLIASETVSEIGAPARLSAGAKNIEENPNGARIRRVRGPAGCGKSFGLTARAARLAAEGKRVLVLSFNVTLANHLSALVAARCREYGVNPTGVTCSNFHSFCTRVVQDAEQAGFTIQPPRNRPWPQAIVLKAEQAFAAGFERRFDAVLVDEGQDFELEWWNLLRTRVVVPGGEMLLVADPTQDVYDRRSWTDEERMVGAGFAGPWTDVTGSYRMPDDMVSLANRFAAVHLGGERLAAAAAGDRREVSGAAGGSIRRWKNVDRVADIGIEVGREVVRLLREHPTLSPRDVAFLCEYHHDGVVAAAEIERAGYAVHHIFSRSPDDARRRRKYRFWPDADGVKGCTVHSFKGWETRAVVMGIGVEDRSRRLAYVAMTRVKAHTGGGPSYLSVINADTRLADLRASFETWAPPKAELRVG